MKQGRGSKEGAVREERKGGKEKRGRTERGRGTTTDRDGQSLLLLHTA